MAEQGSCHCGAVRIEVPTAPEWIGSCNCHNCRKTGWLVAYYPDDGKVHVSGETAQYVHGDRMIAFLHCPICACGVQWVSTGESYGRVGVNARLLDGFELRDGRYLFDGRALEVRFLENAG